MLKFSILSVLLAAISSGAGFAQSGSFAVAASGKPKVAIVISTKAEQAEVTAARQLISYLKEVTGAHFPLYPIGQSPKGLPKIYVGQSNEAKILLKNIDWKTLKHDGIVIKYVGADLVLAGDSPRGTLYAVYTFLEDYVGCKWWTPVSSSIPQKNNLTVAKKDLTYKPAFMCRETYYFNVNRKNLEFASRLKLNGNYQSVPAEYGGHYKFIGFVHTFDEFLPASKYFQDHPEWFSLRNGKRVGGQTTGQLCLTNEEMKKEFIKQALIQADNDPSAGMISISQNDNIGYCQCDNCTAAAKEEGGQSGLLIRFVNEVADEIAKKYPDFLIETLAYQYTRHAPSVAKPRSNVIVRLCSIECDFSKPLDHPNNKTFYEDLLAWKKLSKTLYIWDYVVNFGNLTIAHPNWRVLAPNVRLFAANNVVGLFEQGDGFNPDAEFAHMKMWVLAKLMWNPSLDQSKLMKEFATGYYGKAAPFLLEYIDLICDAYEKRGDMLSCSDGNNVAYLNQDDMNRSTTLFDEAEKAVSDNATILERVRLERLALDHTWILQAKMDRSLAGKSRGMDMMEICQNFISKSESTGNRFIGEHWPLSEAYNDGLRVYAQVQYIPPEELKAKLPEAVKNLPDDQWVLVQENRIKMYRPGAKSFVAVDPEASDGIAIRIPGELRDWAAQMSLLRPELPIGTLVDVYVTVKVDIKGNSGQGLTLGIYDDNKLEYVIPNRDIAVQDIPDSEYHDYYLGTCTVQPGRFAYVAPGGNAEAVENVFVDLGFFIKTRE